MGAFGLVAFALVVVKLVTAASPALTLSLATIAWFCTAIFVWRIWRMI